MLCIRVSFTIFYNVELKKSATKYEQFTKCKVATKFAKGQIVNVRISPKDQRHRVPSFVNRVNVVHSVHNDLALLLSKTANV